MLTRGYGLRPKRDYMVFRPRKYMQLHGIGEAPKVVRSNDRNSLWLSLRLNKQYFNTLTTARDIRTSYKHERKA